MAIKFNHVTNTISFTSGACSSSFVDSSATGIFETTGYARTCYVTNGQTGNFVTTSQTGVFALSANTGNFVTTSQTGVYETTGYARNCYVTTGQTGSLNYVKCPSSPSAGCVICYDGSNWVAGTSAGGGGGGTTLPNGSTENSALCWNGSSWTTGQTYVATGQTGDFNPFISDTVNCNLNYKYDLNIVSNSTGSAIFQGNNNSISGQLNSQINNGSFNSINTNGCYNYIENGCLNCVVSGSCFSEILNGICNSISGGYFSAIANGSGNLIRGGSSMGIFNSLSSCILGTTAFANTILGGCTHVMSSVNRSIVIGGLSNHICASSNDAVINGGRSNIICGAVISVLIGGNCNRLCHGPGACTATGSIIIGGQQSAIVGSGCSVNFSTLINSVSGCISSGCINTIINATCSCIVSGASNSVIIGSRNTISGYTGAIIIGSGITANANNTLFVSNLHSTGIISGGSICGTGNFVTTSQTGAFAPAVGTGIFVTTGQTGSFSYVRCPSSPSVGCVICYDGSNWVAGTSAGGGGGTTLPNGTSANSALCWNGSAWTTGQTYVATGATGNFINTSQTGGFETTGYARCCYVTTGQTGNFGGGGTTLPNGTVANSAICWNGSAWTTGQSYETTGYARRCYVTTGQTGNFLTTAEVQTGNFALLNPTPISTTSTNYTLGLSDNGKPIIFNTNVVTSLFVPLNSAISFPSGAQLTIFQKGTGIVNITGNAGVSILSNGNRYNLVGQYSMASLIKITTNEWALGGDLTV
jgi:hypothetical protein